MRDVVVALALRTPGGRAKKGTFRQTRPDDLGATVIRALLERAPQLDPARIGDVVIGCAMPEGEQGMNVGRNLVLLAGLPNTVPGMTVNRFCSSGLESINIAAGEIAMGQVDIAIAGGVESMTLVPMGGLRYLPNPRMVAEAPGTYLNMGLTAERLAVRDGISREAQDAFAYHSHMKAVAAQQERRYDAELVPMKTAVSEPGLRGKPVVKDVTLDQDEGPRADTTLEALAKLKPAFMNGGTVTAGNSSQMTDGAAAVLLTTPEIAAELKLEPLARWVGYAVAGVPPEIMGIGPVEAVPKVLKRVGLKLGDMDVIELNEAFAAQSLAVLKGLGVDPEDPRINANGGAIALGHPLGCSGARILTTLIHEMHRRAAQGEGPRHGLAALCVGVGQGEATVIERLPA